MAAVPAAREKQGLYRTFMCTFERCIGGHGCDPTSDVALFVFHSK
jgi:hypothetical protein